MNIVEHEKTTIKPIQEWHGYITEILDNTFISRLTDLTYPGTDEILEIEIEKIKSREISAGDVFNLKVYKDYSVFEFEKYKPISKQDINEAKLWANDILKNVNFK